eukprot:CAMPEP_0174320414 /NCGR_PEP_ID=MMETSP0810-20121108/9528_1 /TAXON_ID=73025 ORGANISM="Eutreptiella gymnastica-like, Strain CCMP1594" /NCGR_SAMPLE_ID=MMETSP0810 /ASSEMBLY_ACC=CAM_ASM_000659 /LENGTH=48 /DNA_ID= /DNA_START= /DNA_END= /DNA_ORIENTATION=
MIQPPIPSTDHKNRGQKKPGRTTVKRGRRAWTTPCLHKGAIRVEQKKW